MDPHVLQRGQQKRYADIASVVLSVIILGVSFAYWRRQFSPVIPSVDDLYFLTRTDTPGGWQTGSQLLNHLLYDVTERNGRIADIFVELFRGHYGILMAIMPFLPVIMVLSIAIFVRRMSPENARSLWISVLVTAALPFALMLVDPMMPQTFNFVSAEVGYIAGTIFLFAELLLLDVLAKSKSRGWAVVVYIGIVLMLPLLAYAHELFAIFQAVYLCVWALVYVLQRRFHSIANLVWVGVLTLYGVVVTLVRLKAPGLWARSEVLAELAAQAKVVSHSKIDNFFLSAATNAANQSLLWAALAFVTLFCLIALPRFNSRLWVVTMLISAVSGFYFIRVAAKLYYAGKLGVLAKTKKLPDFEVPAYFAPKVLTAFCVFVMLAVLLLLFVYWEYFGSNIFPFAIAMMLQVLTCAYGGLIATRTIYLAILSISVLIAYIAVVSVMSVYYKLYATFTSGLPLVGKEHAAAAPQIASFTDKASSWKELFLGLVGAAAVVALFGAVLQPAAAVALDSDKLSGANRATWRCILREIDAAKTTKNGKVVIPRLPQPRYAGNFLPQRESFREQLREVYKIPSDVEIIYSPDAKCGKPSE